MVIRVRDGLGVRPFSVAMTPDGRFGRNRRWLTHTLPPANRSRPVIEELGRLLEPLGIAAAPRSYRLDPTALATRRDKLMEQLGDVRIAVLHPFAGDRARCVDHAVWIRVAEGLAFRGYLPLWIGSHSELRELRARMPTDTAWRYVDEVASAALADSAAAISIASLFVGHDSGPLHIASALGTPCIGVFAPGEPSRTFLRALAPGGFSLAHHQ